MQRPRIREADTGTNRDFASLLDDLFVTAEKTAESGPAPAVALDYLSVVEELHSGRITVSGASVAREYQSASEDVEAELNALFSTFLSDEDETEPRVEASMAEMPPVGLSVEPEVIAMELGLETSSPVELGRLRRAFALRNHPDRVPAHLRTLAVQRMQIANALIDAARRKALDKVRR